MTPRWQRVVVGAASFLIGADELNVVRGEDVDGYTLRRMKYVEKVDVTGTLMHCGDLHFWMVCTALETIDGL